MKHEFKFENGQKCKDKITGFTGTITGLVTYITGCNQYLISPKCNDENVNSDAHWFDEDRIEIIKEEKIKIKNSNNGPDRMAPIK